MNIDWSKAPEGTEAGHPGGPGIYPAWYRKDTAGLVEQICPEAGIHTWTWMGGRRDFPIGSVLRPKYLGRGDTVPIWNGEGQPMAGNVCEWKEKSGSSWVKATVLFITESSVVLQREDGFEWQMPAKRVVFRQFKTAEQIAAEERLKAIDEMAAVYKSNYEGHVKDGCQALYDAGYRKVPRA